MINSLLKDSHMTQNFAHPNFESSTQNRQQYKELNKIAYNSAINRKVNNPAKQPSFGGFFSSKIQKIKNFDFHNSSWVKGQLEKIDENPQLFANIIALGLTCALRPAAILALPSEKKNKEDKIYAAAHSISSGIIGLGLAIACFIPLADAYKKVEKEISARLDGKGLDKVNKFRIKSDSYLLKNKNAKDAAGTYIKNLPEMAVAMPRAAITIGLIPILLKYVFGLEKKKSNKNDKMMPISDNNMAINQNKMETSNNNKKIQPAFGAAPKSKFFSPLKVITEPISKIYDNITDEIADFYVKMLEAKPIKSIMEWTGNQHHLVAQKPKPGENPKTGGGNLFTHLMVATSLVLSGFYIKKTLDNKELDDKKKKVLAINQTLVTLISTVGSYTIDKLLDKKYKAFIKKFLTINSAETAAKLEKYEGALKTLKSTIIIGLMYRFIAPVFVTPIANMIGNKTIHIDDDKKAKPNNIKK